MRGKNQVDLLERAEFSIFFGIGGGCKIPGKKTHWHMSAQHHHNVYLLDAREQLLLKDAKGLLQEWVRTVRAAAGCELVEEHHSCTWEVNTYNATRIIRKKAESASLRPAQA